MATTVGEVQIDVRAKIDALANDFKQAKSVVDRGAREMQSAAKAIEGYFKAIGVGLSIAGIGAFIRSAIDAADEMSKLGQKTGIAVKDLAGLQLAFRQSGLEAGALQGNMSRLAQNMAKGSDAFAAMQLQTKNADGSLKSTRDMLGEVADKFASYKDGAEKTALAVQLFGKAGADMIPLLNGGAAGLAEFDAMAQQLGLTMDETTAKSAEKFNDTMDLVGQGVVGVGRQIAAQLLPTLTGLAGEFLTTMTSGDKLKSTAEFLATALKGLYVAGIAVVEAFKTVGTTLGGVFAAIGAAISGDFAGAKKILGELKTDIGSSWIKTLEQAKAAWETTGNAAVEAMAATSAAAKGAAPNVQDVADQAKATEKAMVAAGKALDKYFEAEAKAEEVRTKTLGTTRAQVDALQRQVEAVKKGEAATEALNRTLAIENALRSDAAQKLLPHQREEYAKLIGQQYDLQAALDAAEEAQKTASAEATKAAEAMATAYNRAIERVRDGVGDFFISIIRDGKASFDTLLDFFKQMLAEMIATAAANRIMLAVGMGGASGAASAATSAIGGAGTLSKVGSWLGLGGSGGIGASMGQLGLTKLGMQGLGASFGFTGPAGLAVGAGLNLGAGFAGGYAGNWAGEKLFGSEGSGYGATIGGVAGAIFGAGNPLTTALGAALGGIVDSAISSLIGDKQAKWGALGVTTGTGYNSIVDTMTGASGLTLSAIANRTSTEDAKEMLQAFGSMDSALTQIAAAMGVQVNLSGKTLGGKSLRVDGQGVGDAFGVAGRLDKLDASTLKNAPDQFVRAWLDATADSFDAQIRPFISRIGGTAEEMLAQFAQIAEIQGIYKASTDTLKALLETDTIGAVQQQIEAANRSLYDLWSQQGDAIVKFSTELADAEDYAQLTSMVAQRYQTEIALIGQVMGALQQIDGIFAGTIEGIRLDLMSDNGQRYSYFEQQIETLAASIGSLTDAGAIIDTLKQIDALAGRSYGLLDDQGKAANGQDIIGFLDQVQADADARLNVLLSSVSADKANEAGTVANAIQTSLDAASAKMVTQLEAVFVKQQAAADTLAGAANNFAGWVSYLPGSINVTLATSEVG